MFAIRLKTGKADMKPKENFKTVLLDLQDDVLTGMVCEQISKFCRVEKSGGTDAATDIAPIALVIAREVTDRDAPHLILSAKNARDTDSRRASVTTLTLPLRLGEMSDRVRYILSGRDRFARDAAIGFGDFTLNPEDGMMAHANGESLRLTDKEKLVILTLYDAEGHSMDRGDLLHLVWGYAETAETHTLETHLYRLRQKLEEKFGVKDMIVTKDGIYSLRF